MNRKYRQASGEKLHRPATVMTLVGFSGVQGIADPRISCVGTNDDGTGQNVRNTVVKIKHREGRLSHELPKSCPYISCAHPGHIPCVNVASVLSLMYFSITCHRLSGVRIFLHEAQIGSMPSSVLTLSSARSSRRMYVSKAPSNSALMHAIIPPVMTCFESKYGISG